jgi:hypothetical protein
LKRPWQDIEKLAKALAYVEDGVDLARHSWMDYIVKAQVIMALTKRADPLIEEEVS